jgi:hypothetical protein
MSNTKAEDRRTSRILHEFFVIAWIALATPVMHGSNPSEWRFWQYEQGLADSYVSAITRSPNDIYWICHGELLSLSRMDGMEVRKIPSPTLPNRFDSLNGSSGWSFNKNVLL